MQPQHSLREQQEAEFEVGILASLVAGLDERDDHVLGFISTVLERLDKKPGFGADYHQASLKALAAIERVTSGNGDFDETYVFITEAVDLIYKFMSAQKSPGDFTSSPQQTVSPLQEPPCKDSNDRVVSAVIDLTNPELPDFISEVEEYVTVAEAALLVLEKSPQSKEHIDEVFRCFHNVKGISGFFDLRDFQELAHAAETLMDGVRSGAVELTGRRAQLVFDAIDYLKELILSVKDAMSGGSYCVPPGLAEMVVSLQNSEEGAEFDKAKSVSKAQSQDHPQAEHISAKKADEVVRVATPKLDALIDSVGELVIANGMVQQEASNQAKGSPQFAVNVQRLGKIVRELQDQAMALRMVSLEGTFRKLARVARDISKKSAVPLDFTFEGEDTELDRSVVEEMQSPLVHMIRNAVDHGIESPTERVQAGKPKTGNVSISAAHQGGNVLIRIEDDGRGLDKNRILEKAIGKGLVKPSDELSDSEIYDLICEPGFSTNEQVTEISGRGVGMDVVKKSIDRLRGRLEISVEPGKGTAFSIWLPLTMAVIDGMVITVGSHQFIIPSIAIQESLRPLPEQIHTVKGSKEMVLIRGDLLPMFKLHSLFDIEGANDDPSQALILVITDRDRRCALLIDDLIGQQQVVAKPIGSMFDQVPAVSGASIMGDGTVALILDTAGILRMAREVRSTYTPRRRKMQNTR